LDIKAFGSGAVITPTTGRNDALRRDFGSGTVITPTTG